MNFLTTLVQDLPRDRPTVVFDIGANEGGYTWSLRQLLPLAEIHCFEPLPAMYDRLRARLATDLTDPIYTWPWGVSDREYVETGVAVHEAWTIDKPARAVKGRNATWGGPIFDMQLVTVDGFCTQHEIDRVDFLKIDTDGYELRVLRGAKATILRDRPPILIELGYMVEDLGDSLAQFLLTIYDELGYRLYAQDGTELLWAEWRSWYPFTTTFDVAMLPAETPLRPLGDD